MKIFKCAVLILVVFVGKPALAADQLHSELTVNPLDSNSRTPFSSANERDSKFTDLLKSFRANSRCASNSDSDLRKNFRKNLEGELKSIDWDNTRDQKKSDPQKILSSLFEFSRTPNKDNDFECLPELSSFGFSFETWKKIVCQVESVKSTPSISVKELYFRVQMAKKLLSHPKFSSLKSHQREDLVVCLKTFSACIK